MKCLKYHFSMNSTLVNCLNGQSTILDKRTFTVLSGQYARFFCIFFGLPMGEDDMPYASKTYMPTLSTLWATWKCWQMVILIAYLFSTFVEPLFIIYSTDKELGRQHWTRGEPLVLMESAIQTEWLAQWLKLKWSTSWTVWVRKRTHSCGGEVTWLLWHTEQANFLPLL